MKKESQQKPAKRKSIFVEELDLMTVNIDSDNYVKIPKQFSFAFVEEAQDFATESGKRKVAAFLSKAIVEWNLVDKEGNPAPVSIENIYKLPVEAMGKIATAINKNIQLEIDVPKAA